MRYNFLTPTPLLQRGAFLITKYPFSEGEGIKG